MLPAMIYHLYDDNRQHMAMSESFGDLRNVALQAFQQEGLPFAIIRWSDSNGRHQEMRVTLASLTAAGRRQVQSAPQVRPRQSSVSRASARQRANLLVGTVILVLLLFLTNEIASIILRKPLSAAVFGY